LAAPVVYKAEGPQGDIWVFGCPDCGLHIVGKRVEGLALGGRDLIEVTKPGDAFDGMVEVWNTMTAAGVAGKGNENVP
jgi:predicted RNA-binding protein with PUA domain